MTGERTEPDLEAMQQDILNGLEGGLGGGIDGGIDGAGIGDPAVNGLAGAGAATEPGREAGPDASQMTPDEIDALVRFRDWARQNPAFIATMGDVLEGRARVVAVEMNPVPTPPAPVPDTREAPPAALDAGGQGGDASVPEPLRQKLSLIEEQVGSVVDFVREQSYARNLSAIEAAATEFTKQYGLTATDISSLEEAVAQQGLLPVMAARAGDPQRGMFDALEIVYFRNPTNRQRELDRMVAVNAKQNERAAKATRIAGASGSAPRAAATSTPTPTPGTPTQVNGHRQQLVETIAADIREAQRGQTVE